VPSPAPGAAWQLLNDPFSAQTTAYGLAVFGSQGIAVVGRSSSIAVSADAGVTWSQSSTGHAGYPRAVAFADAQHGYAVGPSWVVTTSDGGMTWSPATTVAGTLTSVAAAGNFVFALGPTTTGITVSTDGGVTWTTEAAGQTAGLGLDAVVADAAGFAAASGSNGTLVRDPATSTWQAPATPPPPGTVALAMTAQPDWQPGNPDLVAVSAAGAAGSDDAGQTFTPLPAPPAAARSAHQMAAGLLDGLSPTLLVGSGAGLLGSLGPLDGMSAPAWSLSDGPLDTDVVGISSGEGSVAYAVTTAGAIARTVSYGRTPAIVAASPTSLTAGGDVELTSTVAIRAPGKLLLERSPAGKPWTVRWSWPLTPPDPGTVADTPLVTTRYRLRFLYNNTTAAVSRTLTVGVRPQIAVAHATLRLRRGDIYRVTGTVFPAHPGRILTVWTDRGGRWHRIGLGGTIRLDNASAFHTRRFGTPVRERYHLQVRMAADASHLAGVSPRVTVIVR